MSTETTAQGFIDNLILQIQFADKEGSVTNEMVAHILDYLNNKYKEIRDANSGNGTSYVYHRPLSYFDSLGIIEALNLCNSGPRFYRCTLREPAAGSDKAEDIGVTFLFGDAMNHQLTQVLFTNCSVTEEGSFNGSHQDMQMKAFVRFYNISIPNAASAPEPGHWSAWIEFASESTNATLANHTQAIARITTDIRGLSDQINTLPALEEFKGKTEASLREINIMEFNGTLDSSADLSAVADGVYFNPSTNVFISISNHTPSATWELGEFYGKPVTASGSHQPLGIRPEYRRMFALSVNGAKESIWLWNGLTLEKIVDAKLLGNLADFVNSRAATKADLENLKRDILGDDLEETFNTLKDVQAWADEHGAEYAELLSAVGAKADRSEMLQRLTELTQADTQLSGQLTLLNLYLQQANNGVTTNSGRITAVENALKNTYNKSEVYSKAEMNEHLAKLSSAIGESYVWLEQIWETMNYGQVDWNHYEDTKLKPFELNGFWLTPQEAVEVRELGAIDSFDAAFKYDGCKLPTVLPLRLMDTRLGKATKQFDLTGTFGFSKLVKVVLGNIYVKSLDYAFELANLLEEIQGTIYVVSASLEDNARGFAFAFQKCSSLREIRLSNLNQDIWFIDSPLISADSLRHIIDNRASTEPVEFNIRLKSDTYAKVINGTDDYAGLVEAAAAKQITFVS